MGISRPKTAVPSCDTNNKNSRKCTKIRKQIIHHKLIGNPSQLDFSFKFSGLRLRSVQQKRRVA